MKIKLLALVLSAASTAALSAAAFADAEKPASRSEAASAWSAGGLQKVSVKGLDVVYARPGASLAGYTKFMLGPISVDFRRDWEKQAAPGSRTRISAKDAQRVRDRLAKLVHEETVKELTAGGYPLVDEPGDDVLQVDLAVVDLWVNAPDIATAGNVKTYAVSAGEMTLVADLRDSATGDVVARAFDRALARENFRPMRITSVDNAAEAGAAASGWAKALRRELDAAKKIGTGP